MLAMQGIADQLLQFLPPVPLWSLSTFHTETSVGMQRFHDDSRSTLDLVAFAALQNNVIAVERPSSCLATALRRFG